MIKKLRRKFVAICMALITAVLAVVFLSVYTSTVHSIEGLSQQVLHRVAQETSRLPASVNRPEIGISIGGDRIFLPYFTVEIWGTRAMVTGGTYANLEDTETLEIILNDCMAEDDAEGVLEDHLLRYLRQDKGLYQKIAFVDMSMEKQMVRSILDTYVMIGLAALALLFAVSVLLSRWATKPVESAWTQQKQFLSDASHELKTPLTVILSNAELLEASSLEERPARWVDNVHSEAIRMKTLVEQMLTLARSDTMTRSIHLTETSLSDIAYDCALSFEPVAFESGKTLEYQIEEAAPVAGDSEKLRQLISILLDNAMKYGADGGTVLLTLQKADRQVRLTVANPGDPIPPEQLSHLFERFYRADASRGEQSGFGLGLSIAAAIAKEHHGKLRAESDSVSTRFILTIPLKK